MANDPRIDKVVGWGIPALLSLVVSYQQLQYEDLKDSNKELENKIYVMASEKASKADLKETESRLTVLFTAFKNDIMNKQSADKLEILAQLDGISRYLISKK